MPSAAGWTECHKGSLPAALAPGVGHTARCAGAAAGTHLRIGRLAGNARFDLGSGQHAG